MTGGKQWAAWMAAGFLVAAAGGRAQAQALLSNLTGSDSFAATKALHFAKSHGYDFITGSPQRSLPDEQLELQWVTLLLDNTYGPETVVRIGLLAGFSIPVATFAPVTVPRGTPAAYRFTPVGGPVVLGQGLNYLVTVENETPREYDKNGQEDISVVTWGANVRDLAPVASGPMADTVRSLGFFEHKDRYSPSSIQAGIEISFGPVNVYLDLTSQIIELDSDAFKAYRYAHIGSADPTNVRMTAGAELRNALVYPGSNLFVEGGTAQSVTATGGKTRISGGTVDRVAASEDGHAVVVGGFLSDLAAYMGGTVELYGSNLALDFSSAQSGADADGNAGTFYSLTGTLEDGTALNARFFDAAGGRTLTADPSASALFFNGAPVFLTAAPTSAPEPPAGLLAILPLAAVAVAVAGRRCRKQVPDCSER